MRSSMNEETDLVDDVSELPAVVEYVLAVGVSAEL